ncbi:Predicted L-lactate dehydrogenase, Fe-S oxidoreductase subunit YkgE [hydrothermal vent metagenome]|uniref:Predicted L-lactate dehydrogenase, Fe-S oxidoreductase subunit YkgE n=1 Tax=hydrothermal vent metagenome TaxID=652676 RepID=A0A3B0TTB6_9ZZZZ
MADISKIAPADEGPAARLRVGLFVTCLVDLFRPSVGFAAIKLIEAAGASVEVPVAQTCCGQPAYNSGDRADAKAIAAQVIAAFEGFDHVVAPSGSCAAMIRHHYPALFAGQPLEAGAGALAAKTHELTDFLVNVMGFDRVNARFDGTVTYHDACSGLRELGIRHQPRKLLASVTGLKLEELKTPDTCCGFGGTFCIKYPDISSAIVTEKTADIAGTGADTVLAGDLGCLMNMAGRMSREGRAISARHIAEVLADMTGDAPPIGEAGETTG